MTLINKIREKSAIAIGAVAIGLALFVLGGDLLSPNSMLLGNSKRYVGSIAGEDISFEEFSNELEYFKNNYAMNVGRQPTEVEMPGIRSEVWDRLVFRYAFQQEYDKLGLAVTDDELTDMISGRNIDPAFGRQFEDPSTGEIDRNGIQMFLRNIDNYPPQTQIFFRNFEMNLRPNRLNTKYFNLLSETQFVTTAEARKEYEAQNTRADFRFLYIPYSTVADSAVKVTDEEMRAFYNKNKKRYEREATVSIEYVTFPITATPEDERAIARELETLAAQFAASEDDSLFVEINSEATENFLTINPSTAPANLDFSSLEQGKVYGPFREDNAYRLYKVISLNQDSIGYARASHILIKVDDNDKVAARKKAQDIINEIRAGASFAEKAAEHGTDGTRSRGGDLGWFDENTMVKPFNDAVMSARTTGLLPAPVETDFGFHVIEVTATRTTRSATVAMVEKEITPSDETISAVYSRTSNFGRAKTRNEFIAAADRDTTLIRFQALNLSKNARNINNLTDPRIREIIRWAVNEAKVGSVSEILELDDQFIVAVVTEKTGEGTAPFERVKEEIRSELLKEKKKEKILTRLSAISVQNGTLDNIRSAYGPEATVNSATGISIGSASVPGIGFAPKTIGRVFALKPGTLSSPIADDNGVVIVELEGIDEASETADLLAFRQQIINRNTGNMYNKVKNAITKLADVKNELYKFF